MNALLEDAAFKAGLYRVGLTLGDPVHIRANATAETWRSDYAELYVVDASGLSSNAMPELLSNLDSVVAKRLRQQRDLGRYLDAHVCIVVSSEIIQADELIREADASRYVSRKYWIDQKCPVDEILRRLTLTWVDVDTSTGGATTQYLQEYAGLRERIAERKGSGAASEFLEAEQ